MRGNRHKERILLSEERIFSNLVFFLLKGTDSRVRLLESRDWLESSEAESWLTVEFI